MTVRMHIMRHWRRESLDFPSVEAVVEAGSLAIGRNEYSPGMLVAGDGDVISDVGEFYEVCFPRFCGRVEAQRKGVVDDGGAGGSGV